METATYRDADGDGYGTSVTSMACSAPAGFVALAGDCDDAAPTIRPGVPDGPPGACNGVDDDCDGVADVGCTCPTGATRVCGTSDGAGGFLTVGICRTGTQTCAEGAWSTCAGSVPPALEACNGQDDDCDGATDEGVLTAWHRDCDADGYGAAGSIATMACVAPGTPPSCGAGTGAWVANSGDCSDAVAATYPGATERCNSVDDDCNGAIDDPSAADAWCGGPGLPAQAASAVCTAGVCTPTSCVSGDLGSGTNCGACGHVCAWGRCMGTGVCDDPIDVATGDSRSFALRAGGTLVRWGGCTTWGDCTTTPVAVGGVTDAVQVSRQTDDGEVCAVRGTGAVICGLETSTPTAVSGITDAVEVVTGRGFRCARRASGSVVCWGDNRGGQLGSGSTSSSSSTPVAVSGLTDAVELSAGAGHACARRAMGAVVCWGSNLDGQLGDGLAAHSSCFDGSLTFDCARAPVTVRSLGDASAIGAGTYMSYTWRGHTCAVRSTGSVVCWGRNTSGQLGNGTTTSSSRPVVVGALSDARAVSAGQSHTCALRSGGAVSCWGNGGEGRLGNGSTASSLIPVAVFELTSAVEVACAESHTCARRSDGHVVCWGDGYQGRLGNGSTSDSSVPVLVRAP